MSATEDSTTASTDADNDSTDVLVLATGLVKAEAYVKDYAAVAERALDAIAGVEAMLGTEVDSILTRGSETLEDKLDMLADADVDSAYFGWVGFLNDEANGSVPAVRQEGEPELNLDVDNPSEELPWSEINDDRISRAQAKAAAKMNHFLFDDYYDEYANVDAVVTLNCGADRGLNEIKDARGKNDWVAGQSGHVKQVVDINVQDQILYSRLLLDNDENNISVDDLHDSQIQELRTHLTASDLEDYGIESPATSTEGGVPASAD